MRLRVVCGLLEVIDIFSPSSRFISVDFPTLGAPAIATNPDLKFSVLSSVFTTKKNPRIFSSVAGAVLVCLLN